MLPFTLLDVHTAWLAWSCIQLAAVAAAVAIAAAVAPWRRRDPLLQTGAALLGAAGIGTLVVLVQAQWSGFFALGIAGGYALWRRGRLASGTAAALAPMLAVKPNLALGVVVFLLGWGNRRVVVSAIACVIAVVVASVAVAGVHGAAAFIPAVLHDAQRWPASSMNGVAGLVASLLGPGALATGIGLAGSAVAVSLAFPLGRAISRRQRSLEPALAGAICLALLASPHLYDHDLALLAPGFVLAMVTASRVDAARAATIPAAASAIVVALWLALIAVGFEQFGAASIGVPGRLVPWLLIAFAAMAFAATRRDAAEVTNPSATESARHQSQPRAARRVSPASVQTQEGTALRVPDAAPDWSAAASVRHR
jgi:energy-converting hydrogenase Eha subunit C